MEKRWVIQDPPDEVTVEELRSALGVRSSLCRLLVNRAITGYEEARAFFRPSLEGLHDPWTMKDMQMAVERIDRIVRNGERIMVYGDYDVDGTTAVTLVHDFIARHHNAVQYYIPDRYKEGYGISKEGMQKAEADGCSLVIALDCGIKALDEVEYARNKGVDVIVCDHHRPGAMLPPAAAVLDPKQEGCAYPFKELSGCGVGFKLVRALSEKWGLYPETTFDYLDLVAISIGADIVPVTGENRILAQKGLERLNEEPRTGVRAMLETAGLKKNRVDLRDVVFVLGPRINAAGRIDAGRKAVELLLTEDMEKARESGKAIQAANEYRKDLDRGITRECLTLLEDNEHLQKAATTVLYNADWHKGVVGIVASRLMESYYRPTIIMTRSNGVVTGSARSVRDLDVYWAIQQCADLVEQFGGHQHAAGVTLKEEQVDAFRERFEEVVREALDDEQLVPEVLVDEELELEDITSGFYNILKQFAPFGPGNPEPVFLSRGVVADSCRAVGKERNHLKMLVSPAGRSSPKIEAIGFGLADRIDHVIAGDPFDVVYSVGENEWNGQVSLQLEVKDIKSAASW